MNALTTTLNTAARRTARLGNRLRESPVTNISMKTVGDAIIAIARHIGAEQLGAEYDGQISEEFDEKAGALAADQELVQAIADVGPHAQSCAYLYLKGFQLWQATVHSEEERQQTMSFGLALILLGKSIALGYQGREQLEKLAYSVLQSDMHLREVLSVSVDALIEARK